MSVSVFVIVGLLASLIVLSYLLYWQYKKNLRALISHERGLSMVCLQVSLPPSTDDLDLRGRDVRDITEETISQAQTMYTILSSIATSGFKARLYSQPHIAFEIVVVQGKINYYVAAPFNLIDIVKQAVVAAYPSAHLHAVINHNVFSVVGKIAGVAGGELTLKRHFSYPIATYEDTKRDAMRAIVNALAGLTAEDGAAIQILIRPAPAGLACASHLRVAEVGRNKMGPNTHTISLRDIAGALWKPLSWSTDKSERVSEQLSNLEQSEIKAIENKSAYPAYETLIRLVSSSGAADRSHANLKNILAAFALFTAPLHNSFNFTFARDTRAFVTAYILRFFPQQSQRMILNTVELATIFHLPDARNSQTSQLQRQTFKQVDAPHVTSQIGTTIGHNYYRGVKKEVKLSSIDRRRHVYIIGQTGTGKSGLLENFALQDMVEGKGFAFIDPHGDSVERLLGMVPQTRAEDVIYFSPSDNGYPIGLNLFEYTNEEQKGLLIQEAIAMLYRLYDPRRTGIVGPHYEHWFRNAALTIMSDPLGASFIDIPKVFSDNDFAKYKLQFVKDQTVLDFWNKEMAKTTDYHKSEVLGWFVSKFGAFLSNEVMRNIIGQTRSGFNLREVMDNKKILLVNLSQGRIGEINSQLLGMIFVMKFQATAMSRADVAEGERSDFTLYVDEFQNFATDSFEAILSQARKYGLSLVLANQFMTQLSDKVREAVIGNVGTVIAGRIGTTDAEQLGKKFRPTFVEEDLTKLPNFETIASVMLNNVPSSPFSMSLIPPLGSPNSVLARALKDLSAAKYGRPRAVVEREILERLQVRQDSISLLTSSNNPTMGATSSFLGDWLARRKQKLEATKKTPNLSERIDKLIQD